MSILPVHPVLDLLQQQYLTIKLLNEELVALGSLRRQVRVHGRPDDALVLQEVLLVGEDLLQHHERGLVDLTLGLRRVVDQGAEDGVVLLPDFLESVQSHAVECSAVLLLGLVGLYLVSFSRHAFSACILLAGARHRVDLLPLLVQQVDVDLDRPVRGRDQLDGRLTPRLLIIVLQSLQN